MFNSSLDYFTDYKITFRVYSYKNDDMKELNYHNNINNHDEPHFL